MKLINKKAVSICIKVAILILATIFIYDKLNNNANLQRFNKLVINLSSYNVVSVLLVIFLFMLLNWTLEAFKWKYLIKQIEPISIWKSIQSVFCGLTLAIFTPNRIGEYGGRVFFLAPRKRIIGAVAMGVGAIGQMVVTNVLGSIAIVWFIAKFISIDFRLFYAICFLTAVFCFFFVLFYFNIKWLDGLLKSITYLKKYRNFFSILSRYKKRDLYIVFLYSLARFIVFTSQYYLIIHLLIPQIPVFPMIMMIFILFFIQSALPSLDLLDIGVRSMTSTYFFGYITSHDVAIMSAAAGIWFINLIIPAIIGAFFVFKLNFFGTDSSN